MYRVQLKNLAKEQIKGKIGMLFVVTLLITVLSALATRILSLIPVVGPLAGAVFISAPFALSMAMIYLNVTRGVTPEVQDTFAGFGDFWSAFKVNFLVGLFTTLWSLLLIVPGIIKGISYSMAMYILAENKGMNALDAIHKSKEMMNGHKMDYFILGLSFIGWGILTAITFGIAGIWTIPYMSASMANFYNSLKSENEGPSVEVL